MTKLLRPTEQTEKIVPLQSSTVTVQYGRFQFTFIAPQGAINVMRNFIENVAAQTIGLVCAVIIACSAFSMTVFAVHLLIEICKFCCHVGKAIIYSGN